MKHNKWIYCILAFILIVAVAWVTACNSEAVETIYVYADDIYSVDPADDGAPVWTDIMIKVHDAADILRSYGYPDDSEAIKALSDIWWQEKHDLDILAKTIDKEAGGCRWDHMLYVGAVVLNRVNSDAFSQSTVEEVVSAPGQYSVTYTKNFQNTSRRAYLAARDVMNGNYDAPEDLYWQAEFIQGKEIWKIYCLRTPYYSSTTYFCRGTIYD